MLRFIDVSNWQGVIRWGDVKDDGISGALIKASEGTHYTDPYFDTNWHGCAEHGLARGAYHYARFANDANDDADYFLNVVSRSGWATGDVPALDVEWEGNEGLQGRNHLDWVLAWFARVKEATGAPGMLYSAPAFLTEHGLTDDERLANVGLWLAAWQPRWPTVPPPWPFVALWQYTSTGRCPGVAGNCDLNRFNGDHIEQFKAYGKPADDSGWPPVGDGVRYALLANGDEPATPERYIAEDISLTLATNGKLYYYFAAAKRVEIKP